MTNVTCLFLKPAVGTAEGREEQKEYIEMFIQPAFERAGLSVLDDDYGLAVSDITRNILEKIYNTDLMVIDANCYETYNGVSSLSPYLYYYIAVGHSRGNATILVANTLTHLPYDLIANTLVYSSKTIKPFISKFKAVVDEIQQQPGKPNNSIQVYLNQAAKDKELARVRTEKEEEIAKVREELERERAERARAEKAEEIARMRAEMDQEIARLRAELEREREKQENEIAKVQAEKEEETARMRAELEREKAEKTNVQQKLGNQPITFRRVVGK